MTTEYTNYVALTHIPRTGGSWLYRGLRYILCYDVLPHEPVSLHINENKHHSHITMIRHPYDIALSYYHYRNGMDMHVDNYFSNLPDIIRPSLYFDAKKIGDFDVVGTIEFPEATAQLVEQTYDVVVSRDPENELDMDKTFVPKMTRKDFELAYPEEMAVYQDGLARFFSLCKEKGISL